MQEGFSGIQLSWEPRKVVGMGPGAEFLDGPPFFSHTPKSWFLILVQLESPAHMKATPMGLLYYKLCFCFLKHR